eukprot:4003870-Alexandrium_andersonii.AAC.1
MEAVATFWDSVADAEQFQASGLGSKPGYRQHMLPLGIHGDVVPCLGVGQAWQKSMEAFSWSSLTGAGACALLAH